MENLSLTGHIEGKRGRKKRATGLKLWRAMISRHEGTRHLEEDLILLEVNNWQAIYVNSFIIIVINMNEFKNAISQSLKDVFCQFFQSSVAT